MSVTGALILAFFATVWWVVGLRAAGHGPALLYLVPVVVAAALGGAFRDVTRRRGAAPGAADSAEEARRGRLVGWASAAEGIAIFIAANVLVNTGHRDAIAPTVALVVGAHFVPLARGLPAPAYYLTAGALVGLGVIGLTIGDLPTRLTLVSAGAAGVLWLTALSALYRREAPASSSSAGLRPDESLESEP
jgi:hypothetical protein